jgi:hypothetical protein
MPVSGPRALGAACAFRYLIGALPETIKLAKSWAVLGNTGVTSMGDIVNLNRVRKARARAEREKQAEENRVRFGRPRAETERLNQERDLRERELDGHKRED